jgi:predicted alpha/beta-fold hydrolase
MIERRTLNAPFYLRHPFLQTAFASLKFRTSGEYLREKSTFILITTSKGTRLLGSFAGQQYAKGLVLLLHGWEGGIESTYMLRTGEHLYRQGYSIFRLNLRDHGDTHHLNEEPFNGTMLDEVYEAILQVSQRSGRLPFYLIGFSLGGNFVLRAAMAHSTRKAKCKNLKHVLAISPAVDPEMATIRIDQDPILGPYFLNKWSQSLLKKQKLFPYLHDFRYATSARSVMELTEIGIPRFTPFKQVKDYFADYTITGSFFRNLRVPTTIYTSADDPIITEEDFQKIDPHPMLRIIISNRGGHNGFLQRGFLPAYLDLFHEIVEHTMQPAENPRRKS